MKTHLRILITLAMTLACTQANAQQSNEQMASYYYQHGEFDKAAELYENLYAKTQNAYYYRTLYDCYIQLQRHKDAERLVERRMKQHDRDLTLYVDLGKLYALRGDEKKSEKTFSEALKKVGYDSKQTNELVVAFSNIQRLDYAVKTYTAARAKMNNNFAYVMEMASLYQQLGQYDNMVKEYFELLDKSPGSMESIQISLQGMLKNDPSPMLTEALRDALAAKIQEQPNNNRYLEMMIWFALQKKDFEFAMTQAKAVDSRFPDSKGDQVMRVASIAESNGAYAVALDGYNYILLKGKDHPHYFKSRVGTLNVQFKQLNINYPLDRARYNELKQMYQEAFAELGKNTNTVQLMRNYAHLLAYYGNEVQEASDMLYDVIELPRLQPATLNAVKIELGDLLLFAGEVWDAALLYMQVEKANKNDVIGYTAKYKNAILSYYNHDFAWAKSQLDVLRASTTKLIANDAMQLSLLISDNMEDDSTYGTLSLYASAELMLYRNLLDSAWNIFDNISTSTLSHPILDDVMLQKAKIQMKKGNFDVADSLLQQLVTFYPESILADDALFLRAQLNEEQLHRAKTAFECYETIIMDHSSSLYADDARKRYNALKPKVQKST